MVSPPNAGMALCPQPTAEPPVEAELCVGCALRRACPREYTHGLRTKVPLSMLAVRLQIRQQLDDIDELAELIREQGLQQPLVVRPTRGFLEVIDGIRRYAALQVIGASACDVLVMHRSDVGAVANAAQLNLSGRRLHWLEEAAIVAFLRSEGWKVARVKQELKRSEAWIYQRGQFWSAYRQISPRDVIFREANTWGPLAKFMGMADASEAPAEPQALLEPRRLPGTAAMRAILMAEHDPDKREALMERAAEEGLREHDIRALGGVRAVEESRSADASARQQSLDLFAPLRDSAVRSGWPAELDAYLRLVPDATVPLGRRDALRLMYELLHQGDVQGFLNDHGMPYHQQHKVTNRYVAALHVLAEVDGQALVNELLAEALGCLNSQAAEAS